MKQEVKRTCGAIQYAINSGVKGVFTAHGDTLEDIKINPYIESLIKSLTMERIIFLDKNNIGSIKKVYARENREYREVY